MFFLEVKYPTKPTNLYYLLKLAHSWNFTLINLSALTSFFYWIFGLQYYDYILWYECHTLIQSFTEDRYMNHHLVYFYGFYILTTFMEKEMTNRLKKCGLISWTMNKSGHAISFFGLLNMRFKVWIRSFNLRYNRLC